jgi:hypothetical protein
MACRALATAGPLSPFILMRGKQTGTVFEPATRGKLRGSFAIINTGPQVWIGSAVEQNLQALRIATPDRVV